METPPQEQTSPEKNAESTSESRSSAAGHIVPAPLPLAALFGSTSPQAVIQLVIQAANRLRMSSKNGGHHNVRDLFDTIQREHASVHSKMMAQQSELEKTRQEMQLASNQVMQMSMGIQQAQMEATKHRHIAETSIQLLQKLLPHLPADHKSRVSSELDRFERERHLPAGMAAAFPGMGGQQMQQQLQMQQMQAAMNPLMAAAAMNPAMAAALMGQQHAAAAAMMHQHQQQQQHAAAQQQAQAHAALAALQQQAAMGQAMGQMGAQQAAQMKMMMAAMGMPPMQQPATTSAALPQMTPAGSLPSPAARGLAVSSTPASPFAAPNGTMASSAAAMARSRKRSSPSTPRAGDTPEVGGGPVPPPNPALALSLATSASSSRSASPSVSVPTSAATATPAAAATPVVDPSSMLLQMQQGPSSSSSTHSNSSTGSSFSAAPAAPPTSAGSPMDAALLQMMAQPGMQNILNSFLANKSAAMVAPSS